MHRRFCRLFRSLVDRRLDEQLVLPIESGLRFINENKYSMDFIFTPILSRLNQERFFCMHA